jgi:hypothetical protein
MTEVTDAELPRRDGQEPENKQNNKRERVE